MQGRPSITLPLPTLRPDLPCLPGPPLPAVQTFLPLLPVRTLPALPPVPASRRELLNRTARAGL